MKKALALALTFITISANAAPQKSKSANAKQGKETRPILVLNVIDPGNKSPRALQTNVVSVSRNHQLCWTAVNIARKKNRENEVVEIFNTPAPTNFSSQAGRVITSIDRRTHTVSTYMKHDKRDNISGCWGFEPNDPKGEYKVSVRINDIQFPPQPFVVID